MPFKICNIYCLWYCYQCVVSVLLYLGHVYTYMYMSTIGIVGVVYSGWAGPTSRDAGVNVCATHVGVVPP